MSSLVPAGYGDVGPLPSSLAEVDEELRTSRALRRAVLVGHRERLFRDANPGYGRGGDRRSAAYREETKAQKLQFDFMADVAAVTGLRERSIYRCLRIAKLPPSVITRIGCIGIADSEGELYRLASLGGGDLAYAVDALTRKDDPAETVAAALAGRDPDSGRLDDLKGAGWDELNALWAGLSEDLKLLFLAALRETGELGRLLGQLEPR